MPWHDPSLTDSDLIPLDLPPTLERLSPEQERANTELAAAVLARLETESAPQRREWEGAARVWQSVIGEQA